MDLFIHDPLSVCTLSIWTGPKDLEIINIAEGTGIVDTSQCTMVLIATLCTQVFGLLNLM